MNDLDQDSVPRQTAILMNNGNNNCRDTYGDKISKSKSKKVIRVVFQNINGLGTTEETDKRDSIREFINTYKFDMFPL